MQNAPINGAARDAVLAETDQLDAVIHFAGVYMTDSFVEIDEQDLAKIMGINLYDFVFQCCCGALAAEDQALQE